MTINAALDRARDALRGSHETIIKPVHSFMHDDEISEVALAKALRAFEATLTSAGASKVQADNASEYLEHFANNDQCEEVSSEDTAAQVIDIAAKVFLGEFDAGAAHDRQNHRLATARDCAASVSIFTRDARHHNPPHWLRRGASQKASIEMLSHAVVVDDRNQTLLSDLFADVAKGRLQLDDDDRVVT